MFGAKTHCTGDTLTWREPLMDCRSFLSCCQCCQCVLKGDKALWPGERVVWRDGLSRFASCFQCCQCVRKALWPGGETCHTLCHVSIVVNVCSKQIRKESCLWHLSRFESCCQCVSLTYWHCSKKKCIVNVTLWPAEKERACCVTLSTNCHAFKMLPLWKVPKNRRRELSLTLNGLSRFESCCLWPFAQRKMHCKCDTLTIMKRELSLTLNGLSHF